jgi:hypothetical protein
MKKIVLLILLCICKSVVFANTLFSFLYYTDTLPPTTARPLVFENAFRNDTTFEDPTVFARFYTTEVGKIKIESGKLIACDASDMHHDFVFTETFPKGEFPVQLAIVKGEPGVAEYVAYSRILFSEKPVKKWSYALKAGEAFREPSDTISRINCAFWGDMGMQSTVIADSITNKLFIQKSHLEWGEVFVDRFKRTGEKAFVHSFDKHNLISISTFFNPCYASYIGYDDKGKPCRLLLDPGNFQIMRSLF